MKNVYDQYKMTGKTDEDKRIINAALDDQIDLTIDEYNRVYNEAGTYIADAVQEDY